MYDRYTVGQSGQALAQHFGWQLDEDLNATYNAFPTLRLPIVTSKRPETIQLFHWGLISKLSNNKTVSPRLYNLPWEVALSKPMYKKPLKENRCLILADGFYAWKQISKKQQTPFYFYFKDKRPFLIAGIWEEFEDFDGTVSKSFNMITNTAPDFLAEYQPDIPAVLQSNSGGQWLDSADDTSDFSTIFEDFTSNQLSFHPVSPLIATLKISDESLIAPTQPSDQHGNYTLF